MNTDYLNGWDWQKEQEKADFIEHCYQCAGRQYPSHPMHGLYTGLWHDFCINEAGPLMRDRYFEMVLAVELYEEMIAKQQAEEESNLVAA